MSPNVTFRNPARYHLQPQQARTALMEEGKNQIADDSDLKFDGRTPSFVTDMLASSQFAGSGLLYKEAAKDVAKLHAKFPPLSDVAPVKLEDPFLIVPGWTTKPEKFDHLVAHLLKDQDNGDRPLYLKFGQAFTDKACTEPTEIRESDKVFVAVFDDVLSPPDKTAPQLNEAVGLIKKHKGEKVDVLGYSMGGIALRKMLDSTDTTLDQIAFLGTPHNGTRFATLADYVIKRDIGWAVKLAGMGPAHLPTMAWMKPVDPDNADSNPNLHALNENWERQADNVQEVLSVGGNGLGTISGKWGGATGGDGLVTADSVKGPGLPHKILPGRGNKQHGNIVHDSETVQLLSDYFHWQESSAKQAPAQPQAQPFQAHLFDGEALAL